MNDSVDIDQGRAGSRILILLILVFTLPWWLGLLVQIYWSSTMIYYAAFCLFCLTVLVFDNWENNEDLTATGTMEYLFMSVFPVTNVACLIGASYCIIGRRLKWTDGILLKGKRNESEG